MKRIGVVIVGLLCLVVAAVHAEDGNQDLSTDTFKAPIAARENIKLAGYVGANDPSAGKPSKPVEFVLIEGGKYTMGTDNGQKYATPIHEVTIKSFDISDTLVTVEQYAECVIKGHQCEEPGTGEYCNGGKAGRQRHPINCVSAKDAEAFAKFKNARLLSEAEYEYAATSKGKNQPYPWGKAEATCEYAVMYGNGGYGCGSGATMPVCSKPKGNTEQGLCDMVGNVWEWTADTWHDSYAGAPTDGSAWADAGSYRVLRGGSFYSGVAGLLRADYRFSFVPGFRFARFGFRLARSRR